MTKGELKIFVKKNLTELSPKRQEEILNILCDLYFPKCNFYNETLVMTEKDFEDFIMENLENLQLDEQERALNTIHRTWLPNMIKNFKEMVDKDYIKCSKCGKYSLKEQFKTHTDVEVIKNQLVYSDCGYGDDDEFADVTYLVFYNVCPLCNGLSEINRYFVKEENRSTRY